ncbi:MAG: hypothetical protein J5855_01230, partial [Mailhella sp.]|nr:hypothetical protein [Mailhella sp.]
MKYLPREGAVETIQRHGLENATEPKGDAMKISRRMMALLFAGSIAMAATGCVVVDDTYDSPPPPHHHHAPPPPPPH